MVGRPTLRTLGFAWLAALVAAVAGPRAQATELHEFYLAPKYVAQGGASAAAVDDSDALFLNPAGLAAAKSTTIGFNVDAEMSSDSLFTALSQFSTFTNIAGNPASLTPSELNTLMGKDIFARVQTVASVVGEGFGIAAIADVQGALLLQNQALPQATLGFQEQYGAQAGYAVELLGHRRRSKTKLRIGIAGKVLWRRGGYHLIPTSEIFTLNEATLSNLFGGFGIGFGMDAGVQLDRKIGKRGLLQFGVVAQNIGLALPGYQQMTFASIADAEPNNLSAGVSFRYQMRSIWFSVSYDYRHILQDADWVLKNHVGIALGLPVITLYGGLDQVYFTGGFDLDLLIMHIQASIYTVEQGSAPWQNAETRWVTRFTFRL